MASLYHELVKATRRHDIVAESALRDLCLDAGGDPEEVDRFIVALRAGVGPRTRACYWGYRLIDRGVKEVLVLPAVASLQVDSRTHVSGG